MEMTKSDAIVQVWVFKGFFEMRTLLFHELDSDSSDWLHMTRKGDDNMIYEKPLYAMLHCITSYKECS